MNRTSSFRRILVALGALVVVGLAVLAWAAIRPGPMDFAGSTVALNEYDGDPTGVPADFQSTDPLARGQYLAEAADCLACHTEEGGQAFAGGRAFVTDFGTIYSSNISPDPETGIGGWSDEDFVRAVHSGVGPDGEWFLSRVSIRCLYVPDRAGCPGDQGIPVQSAARAQRAAGQHPALSLQPALAHAILGHAL